MRDSQLPSADAPLIAGFDFEQDAAFDKLLNAYSNFGFQATHLGRAAHILNQMLSWRLADEPLTPEELRELQVRPELNDAPLEQLRSCAPEDFSWAAPAVRANTRATIFLSFTSNMVTSGLRECFVFLAKHRLVDCIVTTAGGIEEDFIRCFGNFIVGDFHKVRGDDLRSIGWNRTGNIYVPNDNYVKFERWILPIFDEMLELQESQNVNWTPSKIIRLLGEKIENEESLYYWCAKNDIPVFCPALTDGSLGDCLFFHYKSRERRLRIDIVEDIILMNQNALVAKKSGVIILGGGLPKHHVCNANLMRNGADFAVYINTAMEYDGCDSGASPDEAHSWGKLAAQCCDIKVHCDATIALPLLVVAVMQWDRKATQPKICAATRT
uniref:deoxyhypusine synthase n=1 Tax=Dermatophagoides pteronyssinus TaxID=6956 RepID=A0A6P6Y4M3_DERPT|nr:homospermidine synthase 2-like [Dermatophagoides pteronyssinus]